METNKPVKVTSPDLFRNDWGLPMMRRFFHDFDTLFNRMGLEPKFFEKAPAFWTPEIEMTTKDNTFIVRADLPGMKKDEVTVELTDDALVISGERKQEKEEKTDTFFRTERSYGSFHRTIPLPEGVKVEDAKATVIDGVLEVKMPIAKVEEKRRKLEIDGPSPKTTTKAA